MTANKKAERKGSAKDLNVNIERFVESLLSPTKHQGWTYEEVLAEVERRYAGEYVMGRHESELAFENALRVLTAQYLVSGFAASLAEGLNLSNVELKHVFASYPGLDSIDVVKNPYPKNKDASKPSLRTCSIVSEIYPGDIYKEKNR